MRIREFIDYEAQIGDVQNKLANVVRFEPFDFPAGLLDKWKYALDFVQKLRFELIRIGDLMSVYAKLAKLDELPTVPGAGPVQAALDELAKLTLHLEHQMTSVPESMHYYANEYRQVAVLAGQARDVVLGIVGNLETSLSSGRGGAYTKSFEMVKDALRVLAEALGGMVAAIERELTTRQPV